MEAESALENLCMLKALIAHFRNDDALLHYLPAPQQAAIRGLELGSSPSFQELLDGKIWIKRIHFSWFIPYLSTLKPQQLPGYLSLFSQGAKEQLQQKLNCTTSDFEPPLFAQLVLAADLKGALEMDKVIPHPLLPRGPLFSLLTIPKKGLVQLIDYLGLHDLGAETKQIVDKQLLNRIMSALSESEKKFLSYCSKQVIRWVPPKLNLSAWDGEKASLHSLLHTRGLTRLAKATILEDDSFKWHLTHRLDTNRGKIITGSFKRPVEQSLVPYFQKQVFELLQQLER